MTNSLTTVLEKVQDGIGQGGVLDQIDKLYRKQQRHQFVWKSSKRSIRQEVDDVPVVLYKSLMPNGKKTALPYCVFTFPSWKDHDESVWQSLGDYVILAMHRVTDIEFDSSRGRMKMKYFPKIKGRIKHPEDIRLIIQKIAVSCGY